MPSAERIHHDPRLQPERTALAWGRTTLTMCLAAAVFLRWLPTHGPFVLVLCGIAVCTALGIHTTQRARYRRASTGIATERSTPATAAVFMTTTAVTVLGLLGLGVVLLI